MNLDYIKFLPDGFTPETRVWIYQSHRLFTIPEAFQIEDILNTFVKDWKSHGTPVKGYANLLFGQFIVLMADESATGVSGCSTDSSVRVIKEIEKTFQVPLFDRQSLAFYVKDKIQILPLSQVPYALENKFLDADTLYFNNTVQTKAELENNWIIPLSASWLATKFLRQTPAGTALK